MYAFVCALEGVGCDSCEPQTWVLGTDSKNFCRTDLGIMGPPRGRVTGMGQIVYNFAFARV